MAMRRVLTRWASCAVLCSVAFAWAAAAAASAESIALLEALDDALVEEDARKVLAPHMDELRKLDPTVVERVVMRQWWQLARDLVANSHTQQVDLSFAVRKAVRQLKDEADELLRTLNPKYGLAQQVTPAFQWAQNDSCIFLTIKYTVRWNAPGALEVTEPSVIFNNNTFNFTGLGKHSNNKYKYSLSLTLFDHISSEASTWSAASVGKLSVTLRKRWARKWPRLLLGKKTKIGNMHVWMEMQEKLNGALSGMTSVSNSPATCATHEKLYCFATDSCKKAANCSQCPGKTIPTPEENICSGVPSEKASLSFKDLDMDANQIGGDVTITKAKNDFDITSYSVYFGKDDREKLVINSQPLLIQEIESTGHNLTVYIATNTAIPEGATHLLVFSNNEHGEYASPGSVFITDAILPKDKPQRIDFYDEDGDKGLIGGTVTVGPAGDETQVENYLIAWGKSPTRKIAGGSAVIRSVAKKSNGKDVTHYITKQTKIPDGATHLLAYAKNTHGENPSPVAVKIIDNVKPCAIKDADDCVKGITMTADQDPDELQIQATIAVSKASDEATVEQYVVYWGRGKCSDENPSQHRNGHLKDLQVGGDLEFQLPEDTAVPKDTTHLLVFSKNKHGESDFCADVDFVDNAERKAEL
mmetsp:Transcript_35325/g.77215  ORF Transcript_35325/g.77215 Transcript_35325/m.77215 type:complete len:643 (-) Transcript_35325:308-2236(-)